MTNQEDKIYKPLAAAKNLFMFENNTNKKVHVTARSLFTG